MTVGSYDEYWEQTVKWGRRELEELSFEGRALLDEWVDPLPYEDRKHSFSRINLGMILLAASLEDISHEALEILYQYAEKWSFEPIVGLRIVGNRNCSKNFLETRAAGWFNAEFDIVSPALTASISAMALANPSIGNPLDNIPDLKNYSHEEKVGELSLSAFLMGLLDRNIPTHPSVLQWLLECHLQGSFYRVHHCRISPSRILDHPNCTEYIMNFMATKWLRLAPYEDYLMDLGMETLLQREDCPVGIIQEAALSSHVLIRTLAIGHPCCPEEYKIGGVLLGQQ